MTSPVWPAMNALLNFSSGFCLVNGYAAIKGGRRDVHQRWMIAAFTCSLIFLLSYLGYHLQVGSVRFQGTGPLRTVYLGILLTHTVLAVVIAPLAVATLSRALRSRFDLHRKIARITFPLWVYVSVTGVLVYLMLYQM